MPLLHRLYAAHHAKQAEVEAAIQALAPVADATGP
jgi:hypothetical protein